VQRNAMRVWDEGGDFHSLIAEDPDIKSLLTRDEIDGVFSLDTYLRNVDAIFARVFK
jgi:adenylosuccinate lyase